MPPIKKNARFIKCLYFLMKLFKEGKSKLVKKGKVLEGKSKMDNAGERGDPFFVCVWDYIIFVT